ncbi:MAG TPA: hypothetical protein VGE52_11850, partial [Pirellulales bacterium]
GIAFAESEQYLARQQPRREVVIEFRHVEIRRRGGRSDTQIVLELAIRLGMRDHGRQDAYGILYDEPNQRFVVTDLTAPSPPAPETAPSGTS